MINNKTTKTFRMTLIIIDSRSILNSFHKFIRRDNNFKMLGYMNNLIMNKMILDTKKKMITIYKINKWLSIMIKKRRKLKIKNLKILTIITNIKTILMKTIKIINKQSMIIETRIAIKN